MLRRAMLAASSTVLLRPAVAQAVWPSRPVTILVPFVAGGPSDIVARVVAARLQVATGQPAVAENRPGANGAVAAMAAARATPDGHTLLVGSIGVFAINQALRGDKAGYDSRTAFAPITLAVTNPNVLVVNPSSPPRDLPSFVAWVKANPGKFAYSTSGVGSSDHFTMELFKQETGIDITHVPYQGGAAAATDLIAGNVHASFQNLGTIAGHVEGGRLRAIAVTARSRSPQLPDVPTVAEQGIADFEVTSWQAMAAPAGTPAPVVERIATLTRAALQEPEIAERLVRTGFTVTATSPEEFGRFLSAEIDRWTRVARTARIEAS